MFKHNLEEPIWVNLKGEPIQKLANTYYSLDHNKYYTMPPNEEIFVDSEKRISSSCKENFLIFYLLNNIAPPAPKFFTGSIDQIPTEELYRLDTFSLNGLFVKVRILGVIDPITLDLAFFVPADFYSAYRLFADDKKLKVIRSTIPFHGDRGFFIREKCRLINIETFIGMPGKDFELKNTIAKEYLTTLCNGNGNKGYAYFHDHTNTNYKPVTIYLDAEQRISVNTLLSSYRHHDIGRVVIDRTQDL